MTAKISGLILSLAFFLIFVPPIQAAKKFVPKNAAPAERRVGSSLIPISVRYRTDKRAVLFNFSSFGQITKADYSFTYTSNGLQQGAGGTVYPTNEPTKVRELLFGTCSTGVCTYHSGIKDARLTVSAQLTSGKKATKSFRFKSYL